MIEHIYSTAALLVALATPVTGPRVLEIHSSLLVPTPIILPAGTSLKGSDGKTAVIAFSRGDGIGLSGDNEIKNLIIQTNPSQRAVYLVSGRESLGSIKLENLKVTGQVQLILRSKSKRLNLTVNGVDIVACDSRHYSEQPQKYGVSVYQGAFTVYNFNPDPQSVIKATLLDISLGRAGAPVIGSGLFVAGYGDSGGRVEVNHLTTNEIYSNGMLPEDTSNVITGGLFVVNGAHVDRVVNQGSLTTYGRNDMVLDVWGEVEKWTVEKPIVSYGPSGIGFVNFGVVRYFEAKDKIETFGLGARGFNLYDGTIERAVFHSITTHGDGSVGIQVSRPIGTLEVEEGIHTLGTIGETLYKGQIVRLPANGLSIKPGGQIDSLVVGDGIETSGASVTSLELDGVVRSLKVRGHVSAKGASAIGVTIGKDADVHIDGKLTARSARGTAVEVDKHSKFSQWDRIDAEGNVRRP